MDRAERAASSPEEVEVQPAPTLELVETTIYPHEAVQKYVNEKFAAQRRHADLARRIPGVYLRDINNLFAIAHVPNGAYAGTLEDSFANKVRRIQGFLQDVSKFYASENAYLAQLLEDFQIGLSRRINHMQSRNYQPDSLDGRILAQFQSVYLELYEKTD